MPAYRDKNHLFNRDFVLLSSVRRASRGSKAASTLGSPCQWIDCEFISHCLPGKLEFPRNFAKLGANNKCAASIVQTNRPSNLPRLTAALSSDSAWDCVDQCKMQGSVSPLVTARARFCSRDPLPPLWGKVGAAIFLVDSSPGGKKAPALPSGMEPICSVHSVHSVRWWHCHCNAFREGKPKSVIFVMAVKWKTPKISTLETSLPCSASLAVPYHRGR